MSKLIGTNAFVKRQTPESRFTHFIGTWEDLEVLTEVYFDQAVPGYRDGVLKVPVKVWRDDFLMPGPYIEGKKYEAIFEPRAEGEEPVMNIINNDPKIPCKFVDVILYRADVLAEDGDRSTDSDWEIVSINGKQEDKEEPIPPVTMARNHLHKKGGTQANYTADEFAESIWYYKSRRS